MPLRLNNLYSGLLVAWPHHSQNTTAAEQPAQPNSPGEPGAEKEAADRERHESDNWYVRGLGFFPIM